MKENDNNKETIGPKVRVDSWAAQLTPDQQWKLYRRAQQSGDWTEAVAWAKSELHLDKLPGHSAFYGWMAAMRKAEGERRLEELAANVAEPPPSATRCRRRTRSSRRTTRSPSKRPSAATSRPPTRA